MRKIALLTLLAAMLGLAAAALPAEARPRVSATGSWMRLEDMVSVRIAAHARRLVGRLPADQPSAKFGCDYAKGFELLALRPRYRGRHGHRIRVRRAYVGVLSDFRAGTLGCAAARWRVTATLARSGDELTVRQAHAAHGFMFHFVRGP